MQCHPSSVYKGAFIYALVIPNVNGYRIWFICFNVCLCSPVNVSVYLYASLLIYLHDTLILLIREGFV